MDEKLKHFAHSYKFSFDIQGKYALLFIQVYDLYYEAREIYDKSWRNIEQVIINREKDILIKNNSLPQVDPVIINLDDTDSESDLDYTEVTPPQSPSVPSQSAVYTYTPSLSRRLVDVESPACATLMLHEV